ncbi:MAG: 5-formyltetrahydrofolate cyclo-ligase [Salinivirgaceae bacterium]|nr:5-formyltetrahydrofolate cyclo-ligase [Salinivirgaceae bacterium]
MTSTIEQKKLLRKLMNEKNRTLSAEESGRQSNVLWSKILADSVFQKAKTILFYWSMNDELATIKTVNTLYQSKTILLPVIENNELIIRRFNNIEEMKPEPKFGILEPTGPLYTDYDKIDIVIVPGLAFDLNCSRMGRGKGYYDKLLKKIPFAQKYGVGFNHQLIENVPTEEHDISLSSIWTAEKTVMNNV